MSETRTNPEEIFAEALADSCYGETDRLVFSAWARGGYDVGAWLARNLTLRRKTNSPIEAIFIDYMFIVAPKYGADLARGAEVDWEEKQQRMKTNPAPRQLNINPQFRLSLEREYRVDFMIAAIDLVRPDQIHAIVVECDGHEFHKTKEQRTADSSRDRDLTLNGFTVFRFTGTELHKSPGKCASQVFEFFRGKAL